MECVCFPFLFQKHGDDSGTQQAFDLLLFQTHDANATSDDLLSHFDETWDLDETWD